MTDTIILTLPDEVSDRVRQIAAQTSQPVEQVIIEHMKTLSIPALLPSDMQAELDALKSLSDDALWAIAQEQMPKAVQTRAHELMDQNNHGVLDEGELEELDMLVERADRMMLRKAEAAVLLQERGYPFDQRDFSAN